MLKELLKPFSEWYGVLKISLMEPYSLFPNDQPNKPACVPEVATKIRNGHIIGALRNTHDHFPRGPLGQQTSRGVQGAKDRTDDWKLHPIKWRRKNNLIWHPCRCPEKISREQNNHACRFRFAQKLNASYLTTIFTLHTNAHLSMVFCPRLHTLQIPHAVTPSANYRCLMKFV